MISRRRLLFGLTGAAAAAAAWPALRLLDSPGRPSPIEPARAQEPVAIRLPVLSADGPPLEAALSAPAAFQGGALRLRTNIGQSGLASFLGRSATLLPAPGGGLEGYLAVGVLDEPGEALASVSVTNGALSDTATLPFRVTRTDWTVDYITIPPPQPGDPDPLDPAIIRAEADLLAATYAVFTPERRWVEPWLRPMDGVISGYFGEQRSFNGGPVGGHHGGTDIATPIGLTPGAPIKAANHGIVALSERLIVRGNLVVIDHGGGVMTGYAHMASRTVAVGDTVAQGDVIGTEGATGLVTGAHLHWEVAVGGVLVDGLRWLDGSQGF